MFTVVLFLAMCPVAAGASRPRVVSINPCVDAILIRVADAEQIAAISHYSQDPQATSIPLDVAERFAVTSGTAEEVVALAPDLVLAGPHVAPSTIHTLARLKVRLIMLPVAESVAESTRQVQLIADVVGAHDRGEELVAAIHDAIAAARPRAGRSLRAVIWQGGGMVPGQGTLADELLRLAGFSNASADYGLAKWDVLPLEPLLAAPPDVVLSVGTGEAGRDRMLGHPAVEKLATDVPFRTYPFRLLQCGGPTIAEAVTRLAAVRRELEGQ